MITSSTKTVSSTIAPNHLEAKYWVDLQADPAGSIIKVYKNNIWEPITGGNDGVTESQVADMLEKRIQKLMDDYVTDIGEMALQAGSDAADAQWRVGDVENSVLELENRVTTIENNLPSV